MVEADPGTGADTPTRPGVVNRNDAEIRSIEFHIDDVGIGAYRGRFNLADRSWSIFACSGICLSTSGVRTKPGQIT